MIPADSPCAQEIRHHLDYDLQQSEKAGAYYRKAVELEPNNPVFVILGQCLCLSFDFVWVLFLLTLTFALHTAPKEGVFDVAGNCCQGLEHG